MAAKKDFKIPIRQVKWTKTTRPTFSAHFGGPRGVLVANFQPAEGVSFPALCEAVTTAYTALRPETLFTIDTDTTNGRPVFIAEIPGAVTKDAIAPFVKALDIIDRVIRTR